jgi:hypothetical protein
MGEPAPDNDWKLKANTQYQEGIKILMNLATASLALPVFFLKDLTGTGKGPRIIDQLKPSAYASWTFLFLSLLFGLTFYWSSAKFVKVVCGGHEDWSEKVFEAVRDTSIGGATACFFAGLISFLLFFRTL